jgi:hypothetical protein
MTDEMIKEEIKCNCKEKFIAKLKEFTFIAGAVFVGATLSILLCANLLKPKCPIGPMGPRPGIHGQVHPPMMMHRDFDRGMKRGHRDCPYKKFKKHHRGEFKGPRGVFKGPRGAHNWDTKPPVPPIEKETEKI